jgi:NAD(P)-dependent dehydrogenase (short-subunit alcohol dehydrogenase family)
MQSLLGKNALVIGASRGMGKQMALELARNGADVAVAARSTSPTNAMFPGTLGETVDEIKAIGRLALPIRVDLAIGVEVDAMVAEAIDGLGSVDIMVHSVQYHGHGSYDSFLDTTIEELETQMWVNAMSAVRACKLIVPHMAERGGGTVVLVTSLAGTIERGRPPGDASTGLGYPISKAAIGRLVSALAKEVKDLGIAVIGLNSGFVISEHVLADAVDNASHGWNIENGNPTTVPAKAVGYLCTHDDPMSFTGMDVDASALLADLQLVSSVRPRAADAARTPGTDE